jgi:potassium-dependent mechanosensitive channel
MMIFSSTRVPTLANFRLQAALSAMLLALLLWPALLLAQIENQPEAVDSSQLRLLTEEVELDANLEDQERVDLLDTLTAGQRWLEQETEFSRQAQEYQAAVDNADQQVTEFERKLADALQLSEQMPQVTGDGAALQSQIALLQAQRQTLAERQLQLRSGLDSLVLRRAEIQQRLVALQAEMANDRATLSLEPETLPQRVAKSVAVAHLQSGMAENRMLETEVISEPARSRVASAERAWVDRELTNLDLQIQQANAAVEAATATATEEKVEATQALQQEVSSEHPALKAFADHNRQLAEQLQEIAIIAEQARKDTQETQSQLDYIEQDSHLMRRRLEVAGRKEVLGRVMITRLDSLPDTTVLTRQIKARNDLIANTSLNHIDVDEELRAMSAGVSFLQQQGIELEGQDQQAREVVHRLVDQRRELLENNLTELSSLLRRLVDNNEQANVLVNAATEFHRFLLGNLLWVRNFSFIDAGLMLDQLGVLLNPKHWVQLPAQLYKGYLAAPYSSQLFLLLVLSSFLSWRLRGPYARLLTKPTPLSAESLWMMLLSLLLTAVMVLPVPLLFFLFGHFLSVLESDHKFFDGMSSAFLIGGRMLYLLLLVRRIIARFGMGRRMLKWNAKMLDALRSELNWFGPVVVLGSMLEAFAYSLDIVVSGGPMAALATTVVTAALITMSFTLLKQELFFEDRKIKPGLRAIVAVGLVVVAMQLVGLLFAAEMFLQALGRSILLVLAIKLFNDIIQRWLLILRYRLAKKAREENRTAEEGEASEDAEEKVDLGSLSDAHASLLSLLRLIALGVGLWLIWAPSLPALSLMESVTLWQVVDINDPTGGLRAITLVDVVASVVALIITVLVAKHLPSLLQVFMLEWMNISAGARYAVSILLQYVVIAIGGSIFLATIGWEWSKVQWLVAALGVGIGFGLQEIVANFISGVIILFERPVRVGDIITVGEAEGTVTEINARATVIETFDKKEIMVPNKELITSQVINWSLSQDAVRVLIPVGIAYGSNVDNALALMVEAALETDKVLREPAPRATFDDFGDNALLLMLRCYVAEDRLGAWTQIRSLIAQKFAAADIEISFPQRDIHLDTRAPLQVELTPPREAT